MSILIKKAKLLQFWPAKLVDEVDIFIRNECIEKVGKSIARELERTKIDKVIDAHGRYVIPGNVCSHNHFYSALARGIIADIKPSYDFVGVLQNLWWRLDRALDESSLYYSGLIGALEAVQAGTTSVIDHNASPSFIKGSLEVLKKAFEQCGLRGILCYEVTDRNGMKGRDQGLDETLGFIQNHETDLIKGSVGAHAPFTLCDESLNRLSEAVKRTRRGVHIHVAEDRYDLSHSHHLHGMSAIERLESFDLLDEKSLIIHGVHMLDKEVKILNSHGAFLVHNPRSNMNNSVGYNPRLHQIVNVTMGTDGIGSDMFEETKLGYFKSRDDDTDLLPSNFMKFLCNGNKVLERYFGRKFGRIEPGFLADLVILDYRAPTPLMEENIAGHFIFGLSSQVVHTVIIHGQCVYEDRQFPFELEKIYEQARKEASRLWQQMNRL
jgi:putative selenium metabolism protein SsnA